MTICIHRLFPVIAGTLAPLTLAAVAAASSYDLTPLGDLGGGKSYAYGINNNGQIVGAAVDADGAYRGFLYANGAMTALYAPAGGSIFSAMAINATGQITGQYITTNGTQHAYLLSNGALTDLGTLGGANSYAHAINNNGYVVGWANTASGDQHAFNANSARMYERGSFFAGNSQAYGVNSADTVVGQATFAGDSAAHAAILDRYNPVNLGTLGGAGSAAWAINDNNQITGWAQTPDGIKHPFLYSNGAMTDLGTFGGAYACAINLNNAGDVVGQANTAAGARRAFLYSNGTLQDLNNLIDPSTGWTLEAAEAINSSGQIVGYGFNASGQEQAFLLTPNAAPVPLPSTLSLGLMGLAGLAVAGRRRLARQIKAAGNTTRLAVGIGAIGAATLASTASASSYQITDLGTLGGTYSNAASINNAGQIAGYSYLAGNNGSHAFLWANGSMQDLGTLPGGYSSTATAISNSGEIVGTSNVPGSTQAFTYTAATGMVPINAFDPTGNGGTRPNAVNASGQVVGDAQYYSNGYWYSFLSTPGSGTQAITLNGGWSSNAYGINDAGQVTGSTAVPGGSHAFLYSPGAAMHDLGTLGGTQSGASAINEWGDVTGWASTSGNLSTHAFLYTPERGMVDIEAGTGWSSLQPCAINSNDVILGYGNNQSVSSGPSSTPTARSPTSAASRPMAPAGTTCSTPTASTTPARSSA